MAALDTIAEEAKAGAKPIIHIDTHGSDKGGIFIEETKEYVPWTLLYRKLQAINVHTSDNLCVVSAACFSYIVLREIDVVSATPFYLLVAPPREVTFGFVEDNIVKFYRQTFDTLQIVDAFKHYLRQYVALCHCESFFCCSHGKIYPQ
jgi:hypothetical protein